MKDEVKNRGATGPLDHHFCDRHEIHYFNVCSECANELAHVLKQQKVFAAMAKEQRDEYDDYVKRCGGHPVSQIKP